MKSSEQSEAENSTILKLWLNVQGNEWFATVLQGHIQKSDGDPRTGMFSQMRFTVGDTTCSVNGV